MPFFLAFFFIISKIISTEIQLINLVSPASLEAITNLKDQAYCIRGVTLQLDACFVKVGDCSIEYSIPNLILLV